VRFEPGVKETGSNGRRVVMMMGEMKRVSEMR